MGGSGNRRTARACLAALLGLAALLAAFASPGSARAPARGGATDAAAATAASAAPADTAAAAGDTLAVAAVDSLAARAGDSPAAAGGDSLAATGGDSLAAPVPDLPGGAPADSATVAPADTAAARALADSLARAAAAAMAQAGTPVPHDSTRRDVDYVWVLRDALMDPANVPRLVARAREMHVRGLLVQVVGRGDAWYRSELLPPPEPLRDPARDPLGELLPLAHAAGLEVHAWVNCCLVWSGNRPPRDARHVLRAHPEWVARLRDGRPMTRLDERARTRMMVEGVFLSPGHPGVRRWVAAVAAEIARRYPVDGIHLDYIRQPSVGIGFDPTTRARFALAYGADPDPGSPGVPFHRLPRGERVVMDSLWGVFQQDQVTGIVREVRDSLNAVRPGLTLSAAVLADTLTAVRRNRQAWFRWLREGLLDRAYAMCYATQVQTVLGQLMGYGAQPEAARVVPGIAVYNTPLSTAAAKIKGARALGFPEVALYSYDSLWDREDRWPRLHAFLNGPATLEEHP